LTAITNGALVKVCEETRIEWDISMVKHELEEVVGLLELIPEE
jgi:hypothetical protein